MDVGPVELLIVLAVVLLLFGSKKLPELAKGMGQAAKEFRSGLHDEPDPTPGSKAPDTTAPETKAVEPVAEAATIEAPAEPTPNTLA
jgi:sec-independent protein translocase protein TatA